MNRIVGIGTALVGTLLLAAGCGKGEPQAQSTRPSAPAEPLVCYVGGTMRPVMQKLVTLYERQTGQPVLLDYGDSGGLLIRIQTTGKGDLYVCHDPFLDSLMEKKLGRGGWVLAAITPAIAVPKGNPKGVKGLADLARPGMRVGLTHPKYSTLGHINPYMFAKLGEKTTQALLANVKTEKRSGGETANDVFLGHLDAAIVWNAVIHVRRDKLDKVDIEATYQPNPAVDVVTSATPVFNRIDLSNIRVTIATLEASKQPEAARRFAEFAASERGRQIFADYGFTPAPAPKAAADAPPLHLYCGAGLRPAVDEAAHAFTEQTGTKLEIDYAGSGMLISRLKLSKKGDLFMPGDVHYVDVAAKAGLVLRQQPVCCFVPVIVVAKGNPLKVRTLADLLRQDVKLGLGDARACAVGRLVDRIFDKNKIDRQTIRGKQRMATVTVNELALQVKMKSLDAVIVWDAVAAQYADSTDVVSIPPAQNIVSRVAIGVLKTSADAARAQTFVDFLAGADGRRILRKHHYTIDPPK